MGMCELANKLHAIRITPSNNSGDEKFHSVEIYIAKEYFYPPLLCFPEILSQLLLYSRGKEIFDPRASLLHPQY